MPRESGIEHDTRKLAWYYEQHRRYDKPLPVTEAEFLQTYRQQHRDASDAMAADQWRVIQRHPGIVAAWDDAERYVAAWRDACPAWWATVRRAMTVIGWSLGAGAAVWALFFFLRWIVMGFRGRRSPGTGEVMSHTDDLMGLVRRLADYVEHPDGWSEFWFGDNGMLYVEHAKRAVSLAGGEQRLGEALTLVSVKLTALGSPLVTGMNRVDVAATLRLAASAIEGKQ